MSAGSVSLESAIRTCKVNTAWADRVESDRFLNPDNMVCPVWNGVDTQGRRVCADSFWTKNAGCNSASDRVDVENDVSRPQYMEYITLSAGGIQGNIYGDTMQWQNSDLRTKELDRVYKHTGGFGQQFGSTVYPSCSYAPYKEAMAQEQQRERKTQYMQMGYEGYTNRNKCGF
jgi:delta-aminolevulinic acid dehydratase/porphobilinogen synthase